MRNRDIDKQNVSEFYCNGVKRDCAWDDNIYQGFVIHNIICLMTVTLSLLLLIAIQ